MALLNNYYLFVETESVQRNIEVSTHPVEQGIDITDHVKRSPVTLSLEGEIIGDDARTILDALESLHRRGDIVKYIGINIMPKAQITMFETTHNNKISGGCAFSMELKEVRFAQNSFRSGDKKKSTTKVGMQQVEEKKTGKVYHTVKKGETAYSIGKKYASNGSSMSFIMKNNPDAPKRKGDWTTLQIGTKLWVYTK